MEQFLPFFLILLAGVFFSEVFRRFNMPWVIALLLAGAIIGPHATGILELGTPMQFIGQIGLVFLMFMAGLETRASPVEGARSHIIFLGLANSLIPFFAGVGLMLFLGYELITAFLVGIIFISSSVAVIVPTLEQTGLLNNHLGRIIVPATVLQDVLSLVALSLLFQLIDPVATLPLPLFYFILFSVLFALRWVVPKLEWMFAKPYHKHDDPFQQEVRIVLTLLVGIVIVFELLGLHPIIAGFFAGLVLSDTVKGPYFKEKLRAISYGVFIPTFFIITGARIDASVFFEVGSALALVVVIVSGSILAKFVSGWLGSKAIGERSHGSMLIASATIPQLSTTLAVVTTGLETGILSEVLGTALIILSVVTTVISPLLLKVLAISHKEESQKAASVAASSPSAQ